MEKIIVHGGQPLQGTLRVQGSKNASLPILAACVLADGVCEIENCPDLSDVRAAVRSLARVVGENRERHVEGTPTYELLTPQFFSEASAEAHELLAARLRGHAAR